MPSHLGTNPDEMGGVLPSKLEQATFEKDLYAGRITEIPSNMEGRWAYDANDNCTYAGYAPKGLPEGTAGWLIQKFTWVAGAVSGYVCTKREINYGNWTSHTF